MIPDFTSRSEVPSELHYFKSRVHVIVHVCSLLATFSCVILFVLGFLDVMGVVDTSGGENLGEVTVLFAFGSIYLAAIFYNAFVVTSDIVINDDGIGYIRFNKVLRKIKWEDVEKIRIFTTLDMSSYPLMVRNVIGYGVDMQDAETRLPRHKIWVFLLLGNGSITFSEKTITNIKVILNIINFYAEKHRIKIIDCRKDVMQQQIYRL